MGNPQEVDKRKTIEHDIAEYQVRPWPDWTFCDRARRTRVLELLARPSWSYRGPGKPWWALRQEMTGRVTGPELRETIDQLLTEGLVIEAWLLPPHRRQAAHRFMLVRNWPNDWDGYELLHVRGHPEVIESLGITTVDED